VETEPSLEIDRRQYPHNSRWRLISLRIDLVSIGIGLRVTEIGSITSGRLRQRFAAKSTRSSLQLYDGIVSESIAFAYLHSQLPIPVKSPLSHLTLADILERTIELSQTAAAILKSYYRVSRDRLEVLDKADGPVTVADKAVDRHLLAGIQAMCGDSCGYLTEETYQAGELEVPQEWVWIIDPLDGTRDFIDKTGEYAIHIALTYQHRPVLAVVAIPESDRLYAAIAGDGTYQITPDGVRKPVRVGAGKKLSELVVVASRNHRSKKLIELLARLPCQEQLTVGSIGCKIAAIVEQRADVYVSLSGTSAPKDWDLAAPELILTEAGGKFTYQDGSFLKYNRGDVSQWGCLVASPGEWHQQLLTACI
jgi:3'(2'), 5'-bisphosphate nucleotidase